MIRFKNRRQKLIATAVALLWSGLIAGIVFGTLALIRNKKYEKAAALTGGDAYLGLAAMERYGCAACHQGPGLKPTGPVIGPPLTGIRNSQFADRVIGRDPEKLIRWIINPAAVDPASKMPNVGVAEADARNIAAYLYAQDW